MEPRVKHTNERPIIIGTRGSALALWQANTVLDGLRVPADLQIIKTKGDRLQDIALQGGTETGFFTKEIEERLLCGEIDVAVHSLKDLPTTLAHGLTLAAIMPRAPVSDFLLVRRDWYSDDGILPVKSGCVVGAGALRRQSLVRLYSPNSEPKLIRGNVPTRMNKCVDGQYGAVVLAHAGIARLGLNLGDLKVFEMDPHKWLPAPGQGAMAIEVRTGDARTAAAVAHLNHEDTLLAVDLERRLLANFEGGCHTAFGAWAQRENDGWIVRLGIDRPDNLGWGQLVVSGSYQECGALGPDRLPEFSPLIVATREELCRSVER